MEAVFITGGTGFLGTEIASLLTAGSVCGGMEMYVLTRADTLEEARHKLKTAWYHDKALCSRIGTQVHPVTGDLTKPDLGLEPETARKLQERVGAVIHCAAETGFQKDEKELQTINREGTEHVLRFAAGLPRLRRFLHISTAYVAGQKTGLVMEEEPVGTEFSSLYEKSKTEAEDAVRRSGLPFSICRPGMIVGNSRTGRVRSFNTVYYILKLLLLGKLPVLPVGPDTGMNVVPVDYVAEAAVRILHAPEGEGKTFHLTCPEELQPKAGELAEHVLSWAKRELDADIRRPRFLPMPALGKAGLAYNRKAEGRKKSGATNMLTLLPYFFGGQIFDRSNTDAVAGAYTLEWRDFIDRLLAFACRKNFMRQTGSTVFEQAQIRRASRRYPIRYYDVAAEGITKHSGPEVNERIERVTDALWAWGIRRGDRIALTGINSVDYMVLEQSIGRLGAVSVPLYYTTPAEEITLLLDRSGASWLFVGDRRIMEQIGRVKTNAKIVAFSVALDAPADRRDVMHWDAFLCKAREHAPAQHPDPDDLATIRFTSGTTGEPKGVMFTFAQLAWMGEVLTNLLPWQERNRSMRYLSFLPQSHVVEGILASYAPYYMLADAGFYYLNDFGALAESLPKVRPSVFFSVPRFYEKLWDQFLSTRAGKGWSRRRNGTAKRAEAAEKGRGRRNGGAAKRAEAAVSGRSRQKGGPVKRAEAAVLRRALLRKAGLDACSQLIVGSAPVSEELLRNFRELGIEIHNAYGQTEAPLITINRLGDNVIPTVGTPLPETEVTLSSDGELLVRGPQVTSGYYGLETDTVEDGILKTGDLGTIHEDGHISLCGRKKEMIVTAYGKNISIPRIEERLKNIPGVSEAVLIGENRPYCTALLWMEEEPQPGLHKQIAAMNEGLSHPEQIRRYRVIAQPLSISKGELTPNLKVKRAAVQEHYREEIEEMYR